MSSKEQEKKEQSKFSTIIERYVWQIDMLARCLPFILDSLRAASKKSQKQFTDFLVKYAVDEDGNAKKIMMGHVPLLTRKVKDMRTFDDALEALPKSFVINLVSEYETLVRDLVLEIYMAKPQIINVFEKKIPLKAVLNFGTIEEVQEFAINKEIDELMRNSHVDQLREIEKLTNCSFGLEKQRPWPIFVEVIERRNLLVHCDGVVSEQYIWRCKKNNICLDGVELKQKLVVTDKYFLEAYKCMLAIGMVIGHSLWRKFIPHEMNESDRLLSNTVCAILEEEMYDLAAVIGEFALWLLPKHSSEVTKRYIIVNLCLAYKFMGNSTKLDEILGSFDWTLVSDPFKMAYALLQDDFMTAGKLMKKIGKEDDIVDKAAYLHWPLFKAFRKKDVFVEAYQDVFGESFATLDEISDGK